MIRNFTYFLLISLNVFAGSATINTHGQVGYINTPSAFTLAESSISLKVYKGIPDNKLIQTQGGDILLSVNNQGWKFKSSHTIKIEDSLYFAHQDKISESKCILVEGTLKDKVNNINWTLEKNN